MRQVKRVTRREKDIPANTKQGNNRKEEEQSNEDEFAHAMEEGSFLDALAVTVPVSRAGIPIVYLLAKQHV